MSYKMSKKNSDTEKKEPEKMVDSKLSLILRYSAEISACDNLETIVSLIADETKELLEADRCSVYLLDNGDDQLYSWVSHGLKSEIIRFPAGKGLAGLSAKTGETVNIKDAYSDERFNPEFDRRTGYRTRTVLCMPLKTLTGDIIGVFQVLNKKSGVFTPQDEDILSMLSNHAAGAVEKTMLYEEIRESFTSFINTLAETIDARDPMTAGHSSRVCSYALLMADKMNYNPTKREILKYAALLHDLGKIGVREAVLTKPGRLDPAEREHIQRHVLVTKKILERTHFQPKFREVPLVASSHHENYDGSGYPNGYSGEDIPEISRIMAVADVFDAVTYKRHYREPMPFKDVIRIFKDGSGSKFDSRCVNAFFKIEVYKILKIMTSGTEKEITEDSQDVFKDITLEDFLSHLEKGSGPVVEEFSKFYPAADLKNVS